MGFPLPGAGRGREPKGFEGEGSQQSAILLEIVEKYPATPAAAEASRWLGEYHFDRGEWEKAAEYLNQYAVWRCLIRMSDAGLGMAERGEGKREVDRRGGLATTHAGVMRSFEQYFASGVSYRVFGVWTRNNFVSDPTAASPDTAASSTVEPTPSGTHPQNWMTRQRQCSRIGANRTSSLASP